MAIIDLTGFTPTQLSEYLTLLQDNWKTVFGEDLNFDADTPQTGITGSEALILTRLDEVLEDMASSVDIMQAQGAQLDSLTSILSILRKGAIQSNVNATMTGVPLSTIAAGSQAKLDTGEVFELDIPVTLNSSGEGSGFFKAVDAGTILVPINSLNTIVTQVPGWETVTNNQQGATGQAREEDFTFRRRYFLQLAINAITPLDSIIAGVFALDNVTNVTGVENDEDTTQVIDGVSVPAHHVAIAVIGGDDTLVADTIRTKKTLGTGTTGDVTVNIPVYLPGTTTLIQTLPIKFYRVTDVPNYIDITLSVDGDFPSNGEQKIKEDLLSYYNGSDPFTGEFELDGLFIGEDVFKSRLFTPINRTPGHTVTNLQLQLRYPDWDVATAYVIGEYVIAGDDKTYVALTNNTGNDPTSSPGDWDLYDADTDTIQINLNQKASLTENDIIIRTS